MRIFRKSSNSGQKLLDTVNQKSLKLLSDDNAVIISRMQRFMAYFRHVTLLSIDIVIKTR